MVSAVLQQAVDTLSVDDRISLVEYLERTTESADTTLTDEQLATMTRRDAEMDVNPALGVNQEEFMSRLRTKWL